MAAAHGTTLTRAGDAPGGARPPESFCGGGFGRALELMAKESDSGAATVRNIAAGTGFGVAGRNDRSPWTIQNKRLVIPGRIFNPPNGTSHRACGKRPHNPKRVRAARSTSRPSSI